MIGEGEWTNWSADWVGDWAIVGECAGGCELALL